MGKRVEFDYPQIDLKKTGEWLRILCKHFGFSVKYLQEYLHISSNQAIYEWFNGHTLPSVNNLLALSNLLNVPMNYLLVDSEHDIIQRKDSEQLRNVKRYRQYLLIFNDRVIRLDKREA